MLVQIKKYIRDLTKKKSIKDNAEEIVCPHCGYYCSGKGGFWCIDKPYIVNIEKD